MTGVRSVAIVTDSTADISPAIAEAEGVTVVRLVTTFPDGSSFRDGELSQEEFFQRMGTTGDLPTTSQPPIGDFIAAYEGLLERFASVVSIHVSGRLSGTIEAARQAAERFGERVSIVDALSVSWGVGWPVVIAARKAAEGAEVSEVVAIAEHARDRARLVVGLDKLDNLARGGRIGALSAFVGGLLDLKVVLTVNPEGTFAPVARVRGRKAELREMLDYVKREMRGATSGMFCVVHAMSEDVAMQLRDSLASTYKGSELLVLETGVVVATHSGTGWAIGFVPAETA